MKVLIIVLALLVILGCAKQYPYTVTPLPEGSIPLTTSPSTNLDMPQTILSQFMPLISSKNEPYAFRLQGLTSTATGWKAVIVYLRIGQKDFIYDVNTDSNGRVVSFSLIDIREMGF